ncbi:MAG: YbgC/FadM family acyl-CoA thioesterase [Anaerolineae bacterium]|nr:YbgC/FadM family acyl-CoA thioesterase [Anaerolineae bacterium]
MRQTFPFPVRYDDCDPYGHVNHASYLRYLLEAAFAASAAIGYPVDRYREMGRLWFVRDTEIEYLAPLRYGDHIAVDTWVLDFRRVRSRRAYEMRRASDETVVARAVTDWVFLDSERQRPASVPAGMVEAFLPDGPAPDLQPREPFPQAPEPPPGVYRQERRVSWSDLDPAGHVNNACYLNYLEDCAIGDARSRGWPVARMLDEGGFAIVARRYRIEYQEPAHLDELLEVATWISDVRRASAVRHYTVRRATDGGLLARARALWAWVDPASGRPVRIPEMFIRDFAENIVAA